MRPLLALDPGLQGTGYALWKTLRVGCAPDQVGVIQFRGPKHTDWTERAEAIALQVQQLAVLPGTRIVCEFTEYMASSAQRRMTWRTGDMQKLTFLVGVFYGMTRPLPFLPVVPSVWKGQLPKSVVEERIKERLGHRTCQRLEIRTHAWDAVGIGLWSLGVF